MLDSALIIFALLLILLVCFGEIQKERQRAEHLKKVRLEAERLERERNEEYKKRIYGASRADVVRELNELFKAPTDKDGPN